MMEKNLVFIGSVFPPISGPGVKHSILIESLEERDFNIEVINLLNSKIKFLFRLIGLLFKKDEKIIVGASSKLRLILIPYISFLIRFNSSRSILMPVGGKMADELKKLPELIREIYIGSLKDFDHVYVQSEKLKNELVKMTSQEKFYSYIPNFKKRPLEKPKRSNLTKKKIELVYIGRMAERKGIFVLIEAFELSKDHMNLELHFYGGFLNHKEKQKFLSLIKENDNIYYHGEIKPDKINQRIRNHDIFVFPTHHKGEGFPGVLLDAFFAGLPVIASDWRFNSEIIDTGKNGLLFEPKNPVELSKKIKILYENKELLKEMSKNAYEMSEKYDVENVIDGLLDDLKEFGWFE